MLALIGRSKRIIFGSAGSSLPDPPVPSPGYDHADLVHVYVVLPPVQRGGNDGRTACEVQGLRRGAAHPRSRTIPGAEGPGVRAAGGRVRAVRRAAASEVAARR